MSCLPCICEKKAYDRFFYELAGSFFRDGDLPNALQCYCDAFLVRASEPDVSQDWITFYSVQFTSYLLGKRRPEVLFPEGDMVYDLIRDRWLEIRKDLEGSPFIIKDMMEWAKTVRIDFPFTPSDLGFPGQDDTVEDLSVAAGSK